MEGWKYRCEVAKSMEVARRRYTTYKVPEIALERVSFHCGEANLGAIVAS